MTKRYTVVIDDIFYFSSSNLIQAMSEQAIALQNWSKASLKAIQDRKAVPQSL